MMNRSHYDRSRHQMGNPSFADRGEGYPRDEDRYDLQGSAYDEDERFQRMPSQQFGGYRNQDLGRGYGRHDMTDQNFAGDRYGEQGHERWGSSNLGSGMSGQRWGSRWRGNPSFGGQGYGNFDRYGGQGYGQGYGQGMGGQGIGYGQQLGQQPWDRPFGYQGWSGGQEGPRWSGESQLGSPRRQWRAPKGYTRSDERIREEVCDRLGMEFDASDVEVKVSEGEVTLNGSVHDRGEKYRMEELIEGLGGVKNVHNLLQVKREAEESAHSSSTMHNRGPEDNGRNVKRQQPSTQH
jgi:hypothetical protein